MTNDFIPEEPSEADILNAKSISAEHDQISEAELALHQLNESHAFIMVEGKPVIRNEKLDPLTGRPKIDYSTIAEFKPQYATKLVQDPRSDGPKQIPLGEAWINWPKRRSFEAEVFVPKANVPNCLNLWEGFPFAPDANGMCQRFLEHWHQIICNGDDALFLYCIAWMAQIIQDPCHKVGTALVLRGAQGTGKTLAAELFGRLLGMHYLKLSKKEHLLGRFNEHLRTTVLLLLEEVSWSKNKGAEGILKDLITSLTLQIEAKFGRVSVVNNYVRLIITSNEDWVVPAGKEERRFCVMDVSDSRRGDQEYFKDLVDEMENGGFEGLLHFLENYDYSNVNLRVIPKTAALLEQKLHSMTPFERFWFERLKDGTLGSDGWPTKISCQLLREIYQAEASQAGMSGRSWETQFGQSLQKLFPGLTKFVKKTDGVNGKYYVIPDLAECRILFSKATGIEFADE